MRATSNRARRWWESRSSGPEPEAITTAGKGPADAAAMTSDEHRRGFRTFAAALLGDFDRYLQRAVDRPDPARDRVGYRQAAVWVTDAEFDALVADLAAVLRPRLEQRPDGDARRRVISIVNLPAD